MNINLTTYATKPGTLAKTEMDANWQAIITAFTKVVDKSAIQVHPTGSSVTVENGKTWLIVNPNSLLATLSIVTPAAPADGDPLEISFGGAIASGADVVTALTVTPNTGHSIVQATSPSTVKSGELIRYRFYNNTWYRV